MECKQFLLYCYYVKAADLVSSLEQVNRFCLIIALKNNKNQINFLRLALLWVDKLLTNHKIKLIKKKELNNCLHFAVGRSRVEF